MGLALLVVACADPKSERKVQPPSAELSCQGSSQAFARRAIPAFVGRRPRGQAEVMAVADMLDAIQEQGTPRLEAQRLVAQALTRDPGYLTHWSEFVMDMLRVRRSDVVRDSVYHNVQSKRCYDAPTTGAVDDGTLAMWVRDNYPSASGAPGGGFTLGSLLNSSLVLDDISPVLRAHLFQMLAFPLQGANVEPDELEMARRNDLGRTFEETYLQRNPECLPCHNSRASVTFSADPTKNHWWPIPGNFETALYGDDGASSRSYLSYRSVWRVAGVADGGGSAPWGWNADRCGTFQRPSQPDPLGVEAFFGSVRSTDTDPLVGQRASVWSLESSLAKGVRAIVDHGMTVAPDGTVDPDEAFAYLVATSVANHAWFQVFGTRLTIANYFSRNESQRDALVAITNAFVSNGFSMRSLLGEIAARPEFNPGSSVEECGDTPYVLPALFDAFTADSSIDSQQRNSLGDSIQHGRSRATTRAIHEALEWPPPADFPSAEEQRFQSSIGMFIDSTEPGFNGLDFQGRLYFEDRYGRCEINQADFISRLVDAAIATGAPDEEVVVALKDRLVGEPTLSSAERPLYEALMGGPLTDPVQASTAAGLRRVCGAIIASPQFLLTNLVPADADTVPTLTPSSYDYATSCGTLATSLASLGVSAECTATSVTVTAIPAQ